MSHRCEHDCKTKDGGCLRRVSEGRYCWQHRDAGSWWFTVPDVPPPKRAPGPPPRERLDRPKPIHLERASDVAAELVAAGAGDFLDQWVVEAVGNVGEGLWKRISASRSDGDGCEDLAALADRLKALQTAAHGIVGEVAANLVEELGVDQFSASVVAHLARRFPLPWDQQIALLVRAIRVLGILVCVAENRPLTRCACLKQAAGAYAADRLGLAAKDLVVESMVDLRRRVRVG